MSDKKRICIICETPYQVFSAIHIRELIPTDTVMDVYIGLIFHKAEIIAANLKETQLFDNTIVYSLKNMSFANKTNELFNPKKYLEFLVEDNSRIDFDYDTIYLSSTTHFAMAMVAYNRSADVIYYDDGIGSYIENIGIQNVSLKRKLCYLLGHRKTSRLVFRNALLYSPELALENNNCDFRKIEVSTTPETELTINRVFNYSDDNLFEKRIVYFANPSQDYGDMLQETSVIDMLGKHKEECIIRLHPREINARYFDFPSIDHGDNLWEIIAKNKITDQHVLVGIFSTAQVIPKILYDKEPFIVFTYKMYRQLFNDIQMRNMDVYANNLKKIYRDPSRIMVLETDIDFDKALDFCMHNPS